MIQRVDLIGFERFMGMPLEGPKKIRGLGWFFAGRRSSEATFFAASADALFGKTGVETSLDAAS